MTIEYNLQVGAAIAAAPADKNDAGIVSFDSSQFNVDANGFVTMIGGGSGIQTLTGDDAVAVSPDGAGNLDLIGSVVANGTNAKPLFFDGDAASFSQTLQLQIATTLGSDPADFNDAGIASFNDQHFSITNGRVSLVGGDQAIESNAGDDGIQVTADASGNFNWIGNTVANATHAKPAYFKDSATANALDLDIQVGAAITGAPADKNDAGLVSFDDTQFTVDANGFVQLAGGGLAIDQVAVDFNTAPGTDPVLPDGNGQVTVAGSTVANATNLNSPVASHSRAANTWNIEVQVAAAITGAPADKFDAGLASFDDTLFTVTTHGYVSSDGTQIGQTITGDTGGALSPTAGNWNILGGVGANTVGSGSTLTINTDGSGQLGVVNLGLTYSAGTATIKGADGNDLSASNPGYVTIPSNVTDGLLITHELTANYTFDDSAGASSVFAGSLFGFQTGDVTTNKTTNTTPPTGVLFYLIALHDSNDANLIFAASPRFAANGTSNLIFDSGSGNADDYVDIITLESVTIADYQNVNCTPFGLFRMDKTAGDDWTITDVSYPLNFHYSNVQAAAMPLGAQGAATNSIFRDNGGTAPTLASTSNVRYSEYPNNITLELDYYLVLSGSPAGAVDAVMNLPPKRSKGNTPVNFSGYLIKTTGEVYPIRFRRSFGVPFPLVVELWKADGTSSKFQYNEFSSGDIIEITAVYNY